MSEPATVTSPIGFVVKAARRLAVALTISIAVGLLMMHTLGSATYSLFPSTTIGLSATTAFAIFEVWPRTLPRWFQRWALQVVASAFVCR